jgi:hypothetical protein
MVKNMDDYTWHATTEAHPREDLGKGDGVMIKKHHGAMIEKYPGLQPPEPWLDPHDPSDLTERADIGKGFTDNTPEGKVPVPTTYEEFAITLGKMVDEKQLAYGDSFGKSGAIMRVLYPTGIDRNQLDDVLVVIRVIDKLFRIATRKQAFGESPWRDIAGYAILAAKRDEDGRKS